MNHMIPLLLHLLLPLVSSHHQINGQPTSTLDKPSIANVSTSWTMDIGGMPSTGTKRFQPILTSQSPNDNNPLFSCGFLCNYIGTSFKCVFGVVIFPNRSITMDRKLIWSANRNNPISGNGTLKLVEDGNLLLMNSSESLVWNTSTAGKSVTSLYMSENGNLILFDNISKKVIWQSFDYPTDSLLPGQVLLSDQQKLVSNKSSSDLRDGLYSLLVQNNRLVAQFTSNEVNYTYYTDQNAVRIDNLNRAYFDYRDGIVSNALFVRLEVDGHLRSYEWSEMGNWVVDKDMFTISIGVCGYPKVCGDYGICSEGQCSCPKVDKTRFYSLSERNPNLGCKFDHKPIDCKSPSYDYELVEIKNVSYFGVKTMFMDKIDLSTCQLSCLKNCSCKSILFIGKSNKGDCLSMNEVLSLMDTDQKDSNTTLYVKVPLPKRKTNKWRLVVILSTSIGSTLCGLVLVIIWVIQYRKKIKLELQANEYFINQVKGIPSRFSFEQLRLVTNDFK
ncbi:EP1-like glycoprotein 3 [Impatiens glandulifera]|uniref:EP1-like glycoprotein 3 n=1 Tax=Impatiens glandulifera TaxID=253017 RepID=UPI001FB11DA0|nr:EP1-like glycoprotein 3 [Impatiens glandulifera]